ncbi:MAG: hypothetical protein HYY30_04550 [Chloroflexi bacterium]|nr:hypothetical protein [Chloroflexota bacterium]
MPWVYLGKDVNKRDRVARILGNGSRVKLGSRVNESARRIRDDFNRAVALFGGQQQDELFWWSTNLSYRVPDVTDFLLLIAYVLVFDDLVQKHTIETPKHSFVVVVEDLWCYKTLAERYRDHEYVSFQSNISFQMLLLKGWYLIRGLAARTYVVLALLYEKLYFARLASGHTRRESADGQRLAHGAERRTVWSYALIENRLFDHNGRMSEVYLPGLERLVAQNGEHLLRFTNLLMDRKLYRLVSKNLESTEVMIRNARVTEIIASMFRFPRFNGSIRLQSLDLGLNHLLEREKWREIRGHGLTICYIWFHACERLMDRLSQGGATICYWYENQSFEKLLCLARNRIGAANVVMLAYQHSSVSKFFLGYFPAPDERKRLPSPDWVLTSSCWAHEMLLSHGYPPDRTIMAGSLRYSAYTDGGKKWEIRATAADEALRVYVALPYDALAARELLVELATRDELWMRHGVKFFIRNHPHAPFDRIGILPDRFGALARAGVHLIDCMDQIDLLLSCNTTMSVEGLALGMPVLCYEPEGMLCMGDPAVDVFPDHIHLCGAHDLEETILRFRWNYIESVRHNGAEPSSVSVFSAVQESVWLDLLADSHAKHK